MYEFSATLLTVVYISGSFGVNLLCRDVTVDLLISLFELKNFSIYTFG